MRKKGFLSVLASFVFVLAMVGASYAGPWVGLHLGPNFTGNSSVDVGGKTFSQYPTNAGFAVGAIGGYDFDNRNRVPNWMKYFGGAVDFTYNTFTQPEYRGFSRNVGNQYALTFFLKARYPLMKSTAFPEGRLVPYLMAGPGVLFTNTNTNACIAIEPGVEYYVTPKVTVGASYRFRHAFGNTMSSVNEAYKNDGQNQHMVLARVAYHF